MKTVSPTDQMALLAQLLCLDQCIVHTDIDLMPSAESGRLTWPLRRPW